MVRTPLDVADGLPPLGSRSGTRAEYVPVRTVLPGAEGAEPQRSQNEQAWRDLQADGGLPEAQQPADSSAKQEFRQALRSAVRVVQADLAAASGSPEALHGLDAAIGVEYPLTHRVGHDFGQPRGRDPQQDVAAGIAEALVRALDGEVTEDAQAPAPELARIAPDLDRVALDLGCVAPGVVVADPGAPAVLIHPVTLWPDPCPAFTYLAGPAGCGKTFAVKDWQQKEKGLMLLATTGIAALNLGGTTVNAALGYFDTKSLQESYTNGFLSARLGRLWRSGVKRLVLDEVSMLDGDQLTYLVKGIEEVNGRGYVLGKWTDDEEAEPPAMGLTLVGDFAQLRPVQGTFAWESPEWGRFAEAGHTITLSEIRRQTDPPFVEMLRQARVGNGAAVLEFMRGKIHQTTDDSFEGPTLFATNAAVDRYNWIRLARVQGPDLYFENRREGEQRSEWGSPKKPPNTWGVPIRYMTKVGALVMILANLRAEGPPPQPFIYVNGDLGTVVGGDACTALVELQRNKQVVRVGYVRREVLVPIDSARRKELRDKGQQDKITENGKFEITGWIEYMPLKTAYGSTVHKSQGLSLDAVQVNIRDAFFKTPGMLYVALSRARTAAGLRLVGSAAALLERCTADPRLKDFL